MERAGLLVGLGAVVVVAAAVYSEALVQKKPYVDPVTKKPRVTVTYWEKWSDFEAEAMRKVVNDFNASQDQIYVDFLSVSGVDQKTLLATASGDPPDLAGLYGTNTSLYHQFDALTDLSDMARDAGITKDKYIASYWDLCDIDGRLYALPTTPATVALHYNRAMLKAAGLDPNKAPETIEDLDEMDNKLRKMDGKKVLSGGFLPAEPGWWPWAWPYYFGGSLYDTKTNKPTADRPENIKAYEWMAGYAKRYGADSFQDFRSGFGGFNSTQNAFISGKIASVLQGVWMANFIQKYNKDLDWVAVPFPYPKDHPELKGSSMVDLDIIVIPRGARHPKEAFEFLKYVQGQGPMEKLCKGQKKFSPLAVQSPDFEKDHPNPYIHLFREMATWPTTISPPKTPIWGEYQSELGSKIDAMNLGKITPAQAMKELQEKALVLQKEVDDSNAARKKVKP